jgi:hypothetical protein
VKIQSCQVFLPISQKTVILSGRTRSRRESKDLRLLLESSQGLKPLFLKECFMRHDSSRALTQNIATVLPFSKTVHAEEQPQILRLTSIACSGRASRKFKDDSLPAGNRNPGQEIGTPA